MPFGVAEQDATSRAESCDAWARYKGESVMWIKRPRGCEMHEEQATPEAVFFSRRSFVAGGLGLAGAAVAWPVSAEGGRLAGLYSAKRNEAFEPDRPVTPEEFSADHNN